jgi:hypothetical protein
MLMRCSRSFKGRRSGALVIISLAAALASCGGSPRTTFVSAPQQTVTPGHDSPQAAVAGYMAGYVDKDEKAVCEYVAPPQAGLCKFLVGGTVYSLSPWRIGNSMIRKDEAIVVVIADKWCAAKVCVSNNDPNKGLPPRSGGFGAAFAATSNAVPSVSVVRVDGKWYVALA